MITEKDARAGAARDMGFLAELDFQIMDNHKLTLEVGRLEDENAKLRKLARKMWKPFCWAQSGYDVCLSDEEDREIRDLARELRIEASD